MNLQDFEVSVRY